MTLRFSAALQATGFATGGKLGARLATRLGIAISWMTILRRMMALPTPEAATVTVLGIDDFCATRSYMSSCKDSRREDLTWSSASSALPG
jgi:hypothetical protein